jgi:hypothetical protein
LEYWEVWYPMAAATGLLVGRGMIDPAQAVIVHAAPNVLTVEVKDENGTRLAYGKDLEMTDDTPMCKLSRQGNRIVRQDIWPTEQDYGTLVLLPGGEVGTLLEWWNAQDKKEWRWRVEFYNTLR